MANNQEQAKIYDDPLWKKALKKPGYASRKLTRKMQHIFQDAIRLTTQNPEAWGIINQTEIRMIGLRRSGNHALIKWIQKQQEGKFTHINDIPVRENPYRHEYEYFIDHYPEYPKVIQRLQRESRGIFEPKDCLIYNYEDHTLGEILDPGLERKHDWYVGKSAKRIDILIMRDPFNLLASRIKKGFISVKSTRANFTDLWLSYAREFVGETNYLTHNKVCVSYNRWIQDEAYRREIAEQLGLTFTDAGFNHVARRAGGSSFDGTQHNGDPTKMDLTGRWRHYLDNNLYRSLLNNPEIMAYSEKIFGQVEGLNEVRSVLNME
ncbi:MAG: hypothetical protein IGR92_01130 [Leptolyngbyaceae cyanobacterium T60_A2020_046]|nr:hypothetical protein [Leptolyngbyaceae cyanobacterium T60_A2020_046]